MQNTWKIVLWILIVLVLAGGAYYWYANRSPIGTPSLGTEQQTQAADPSALPSGSDTSDAALQQDSAAIDTQMSGMNDDTASIDSGLNDQQVPQQ